MMVGPEVRKYSGHPPWGSQGELQTCRAFIALLEQKRPDINQRVNLFSDFLEGPALDWFLKLEGGLKQDWNYLQSELKSKFSVPSLSIVQKFQVRQSILMQWPKERVQDFVERCILAQFAIEETGKDKVDLHHEPSFERDVLLNVLLGLRQDLQAKVIEKAENQQTLADFLLLAQNVEKELASAVQSIDMVQDEKKPLLKTYLKSEPLEERLSDDGQAEELVRLNMDSHTHSMLGDMPNFNEILPKTGEGKWMVTIDTSSLNSKPKSKSARVTYYEEGIDSESLEEDTGFLEEDEYIIIESDPLTAESEVRREETPEEWVKKNLLNDETKKLKRGRCDPLTYLEETYGALPQTFECSICGRHCQDEKKYNLHLLVRHRKNQSEFACDLCQKVMKTEDSLKKHVRFTCLNERPVSCHICEKPFIDNKSVRIHVQSVHMKEKPHLCPSCGKGFGTPISLKSHRENVHEKLKKYTCKVCGKTFGNQGNLYVHNQRHHERYNFFCDTCGKQFCRPFELRRHMAVKHGEGEMPYPCDQCEKKFFEPKELRSHIAITHQGERPCSCPCCPETFTRKSAMRRHIKRKHADMASLFIQSTTNSAIVPLPDASGKTPTLFEKVE